MARQRRRCLTSAGSVWGPTYPRGHSQSAQWPAWWRTERAAGSPRDVPMGHHPLYHISQTTGESDRGDLGWTDLADKGAGYTVSPSRVLQRRDDFGTDRPPLRAPGGYSLRASSRGGSPRWGHTVCRLFP